MDDAVAWEFGGDVEVVQAFSRRIYHGRCWYCGVEIVKRALKKGSRHSGAYWNTKTKDHVLATSNGGMTKWNIVPACLRCNTQKAALTVDEFRICFFGIHSGAFFGERVADAIRDSATPGRGFKMPDLIPMNKTTACIEQYEQEQQQKKAKQLSARADDNREFFAELWMKQKELVIDQCQKP